MKNSIIGLLVASSTMWLIGCSTDAYVSKENIDKFGDPRVEKFLIQECIVPERDIRIAMASHFDFDKSELKEQDKASIDQLIDSIRHLHGQVAIVAHTDYQGSDDYNVKLSLRRAEAVKAYMQSQLEAERYDWEVKYYGESKPLVSGTSTQANAENRRAYVVFEQTQTKQENPFCDPPKPERKVFVAMTSHFDFDESELQSIDKPSLDEFAENLKGLNGRVMIAGHTDYQGSISYNEALAERRAYSVQQYLQTKLDPNQYVWEVKSFGELNPITQEQSVDANALNRRALIVFKEGPLPENLIAP
ncbi:OmpA family protein [Vibrio atypicus]|jgi:outer membrane protein OmpA-like peptidoglycan-associated protein|uniref:OmpA family protein n=1 Tax=Vibrio atypicus TaxID=558271 RepID=UPI00135B9EBC|nr:OmpA family protein [Vibrio atypicus]